MIQSLPTADQTDLVNMMKLMVHESESYINMKRGNRMSRSDLSLFDLSILSSDLNSFTKNVPFGSNASRFDPSYDCQLLFNKSPGPGSYNTSTVHLPDIDIDTDTLITL